MPSEETYRHLISGQQRGVLAAGGRALLHSLSFAYQGITAGRNYCFNSGLRTVTKVGVPVISVGNLTTGGTGKTPMVATMVRMLQQLDRQPGIVSRGYHADDSGTNDEKRVLEHLCPGIPHVQNPDRIAAAKEIIRRHQVDAIVLDDGFQHRRIARDLDMVLIDATNPFGYDYVLPRGLLRESVGGLRRADQVVITRSDQVSESRLAEIENRIRQLTGRPSDLLTHISFQPTGLLDIHGSATTLEQINKRRVLVMSAIGNPTGFVETCSAAGANIVASRFFPDHHHYTASDLAAVQSQAAENQVDVVLTTVKDLVKLRLLDPQSSIPIQAVEIATSFRSTEEEQRLLASVMQTLQQN